MSEKSHLLKCLMPRSSSSFSDSMVLNSWKKFFWKILAVSSLPSCGPSAGIDA